MIDRETMEYAAKAAGYKFLGIIHEEGKVIGALVKIGQRKVGWKPPVKDGDALRLVEKCRMNVVHDPLKGGWHAGAVVHGLDPIGLDSVGPRETRRFARGAGNGGRMHAPSPCGRTQHRLFSESQHEPARGLGAGVIGAARERQARSVDQRRRLNQLASMNRRKTTNMRMMTCLTSMMSSLR